MSRNGTTADEKGPETVAQTLLLAACGFRPGS